MRNNLDDDVTKSYRMNTQFMFAMAILELKQWGGSLMGQGKSRGANINVYLAW